MSAYEAVLAELGRLKAVDSPEGQLALSLAEMVDLGTTGATVGAAANAKQCEALLEKLRSAQPVVKSDLDKIRERRAKRTAG